MEAITMTFDKLASELEYINRRIADMTAERNRAIENKGNVRQVKIEISYDKGANNVTYYANNRESINDYVIDSLEKNIIGAQDKAKRLIKDFKEDEDNILNGVEEPASIYPL